MIDLLLLSFIAVTPLIMMLMWSREAARTAAGIMRGVEAGR